MRWKETCLLLSIVALMAWATAAAQSPGSTPMPPVSLTSSFEVCDNGMDDDGDGVADCDDASCAGSPLCADSEVNCEEETPTTDFANPFLGPRLVGPGKKGQCSDQATDTDGRDPRVAGCLTHWQNNNCGAPAIGWRWDYCVNARTLREVYTLHADKKSCASPSLGLERPCSTWLDWHGNNNGIADECPPNSMAICINQPLMCGGAIEQVGLCGCTVPPPPPANPPVLVSDMP